MAHGEGVREVAWRDCAGGGQVVLDGDRAYIGHMDAPPSDRRRSVRNSRCGSAALRRSDHTTAMARTS